MAFDVHFPQVGRIDLDYVRSLMNPKTFARFQKIWRLTTCFEPSNIAVANPMKCPNKDAAIAVESDIAVRLPPGTPVTCHAFSVLEEKFKVELGKLVTRRRPIDWAKRFNDEHAAAYQAEMDLRHLSYYFSRVFGECGATFDLKASFFQVGLPNAKLFTFMDEEGNVYGLTRLPMGICTAPEIMQIVMSVLSGDPLFVKPQYSSKVATDVWIDNVMFSGAAEKVRKEEVAFTERAQRANATINVSDSSGVSEKQVFIGVEFDFAKKTVDWSSKTAIKIHNIVFKERMTAAEIETAASRLMYASSIRKVRIANYYWAFKFVRRMLSNIGQAKFMRRDTVVIPRSALHHFKNWQHDLLSASAQLVERDVPASYTMWSDASMDGWGAVVIDERTQQVHVTGARWSEHMKVLHINILEAVAVRYGLAAFPFLRSNVVSPLIDNTSVIGAITKGASPSLSLNRELLLLNRLLDSTKIRLRRPQYVESSRNPADFWSRHFDKDTSEWVFMDSRVG